MKVDVIVKQAFVDDLRAELNAGGLNPNDYLTARFAIPEVFVSSTPTQNGQPRDLYQAPVDLGAQPLRFEKNGETIHKLRPVEAYVVDDQGNRIDSGLNNRIRTGQVWQLRENAPGLAEMSVRLGDLANAPEGDVVIDPSMQMVETNVASDTHLEEGEPDNNFGSSSTLFLGGQSSTISRRHVVIGFSGLTAIADKSIHSAKLNMYVKGTSSSSTIDAAAFKVTNDQRQLKFPPNDN